MSKVSYFVRKTTKHIEALDRACFPFDPWDHDYDYGWELFVRVSDTDSIPIGYGCIKLYEKAAFFCRAGIIKEYRGHGLHKRLIRARINWTKRNGYASAISYTTRNTLASANNLIDCGFRLYNPEFCWGDNEWLYLKLDCGNKSID